VKTLHDGATISQALLSSVPIEEQRLQPRSELDVIPEENPPNDNENKHSHTTSILQQSTLALQKSQEQLEAELADLKLLQSVSAELISEHNVVSSRNW